MAFSGMMLTTSGKILFAKGQQGKELKYTRFAIGDGINSSDLINRTGLISEKLTVPIDAVQLIDNETTAAIVVTISNETLATGFYFNEMGLFAQDPDTGEEKLYLYDNAGEQGEYIPDKDSGSKVYERYRILTKADNVQNVTFIESGNPIYLTSLDIDDTITSSSSLWSSEKISREISEASNIETLNSIKANTEQTITDVAEIDVKIGNTNDEQSSSTSSGSLFAKVNYLVNQTKVTLNSIYNSIDWIKERFLSHWTDARAAKLDNLDATVSSRAAANTALSNEMWTDERAGRIDDIYNFSAPAGMGSFEKTAFEYPDGIQAVLKANNPDCLYTLAKFIAPADGIYEYKFNVEKKSTYGAMYLAYAVYDIPYHASRIIENSSGKHYMEGMNMFAAKNFQYESIGAKRTSFKSIQAKNTYQYDSFDYSGNDMDDILTGKTRLVDWHNNFLYNRTRAGIEYFHAKKGDLITIYAGMKGSYSNDDFVMSITNQKIMY